MEFEKLFKKFTVGTIIIILVTALFAASFFAVSKAKYNATGEKTKTVGNIRKEAGIFYEHKLNF